MINNSETKRQDGSNSEAEIDYTELDDDIVDVVRAMNHFDGIETRFSCAGHESEGYVTGYVQFRTDSLDSLAHLLDHLPHSAFGLERKPAYRGSGITVRYHAGELQFTVRLGGKRKAVQREWLAETATSLQDPCPTCRMN